MTELTVAIGLLCMLVCVAFAVLHSLRLGHVTLLDWSVLGMGGIYGGCWALIAFVTKSGENPVWERALLPFEHLYPLHTLSMFILLGSIYIGWLLMGSLRFRPIKKLNFASENSDGRLILAGWVLLIIALFMQFFYSHAYGGLMGLLEYSASIRSGIFTVENPMSFLKPFGGMTFFSSFLFFGLWLGGCRRWIVKIGFILAFSFSFYILFSWLGRIGFFVYIATLVLSIMVARRVRPIPLLVGGGLTMLFILIGAYQLSVWLNIKVADDLISFLARELSFPFVSFFAQIDSGEHLLRGFWDILVAPVYLLPSSWWTKWVENVSQVNTELVIGAPKGVAGVTGAIPVDLITLGLMQAALAGIAGVGFIFGAGLRLLQKLLDRVRNFSVRAVFEAHLAIKIAVLAIFYAQPALVVSDNFALLVSIIIIVFVVKLPRIRLFKKPKGLNSVDQYSPSPVKTL